MKYVTAASRPKQNSLCSAESPVLIQKLVPPQNIIYWLHRVLDKSFGGDLLVVVEEDDDEEEKRMCKNLRYLSWHVRYEAIHYEFRGIHK